MPDRYWVGGTASWDGTAGTKWAATSGGAGGASVPTSADDVFFDAASGAGTVTIATGNTGARSINCTGFTGTITGTANITVAGSVTLVAAMTYTNTGTMTFSGTGTLITAGKVFSGVTVNGAGITLTLGDSLTTTAGRGIIVTSGTFSTANFSLTTGELTSTGSLARVINLGSSTVNLTATGGFPVNFAASNLTFSAGTSQINYQASTGTFIGAGLTFHNVSFTSTGTGTRSISGSNIFNNLSLTAPSSAGVAEVALEAGAVQTINGTLSTTGTAGNRRVWFRSSTYGISTRLVVNSAPSLTDADFRDVIVTGTAAPISGTRIGDLRGNSGIVFSTPKSVFRIGTGNWSADQWAAISGGAVSTDNFPLAQDTAVFNNSTTAGTHTMDAVIPYCGTVDMSARTSALTLSLGTGITAYGNWINGSGITLSGAQTLTFSGRNTQTITSAGSTFSGNITVDTYGGTVVLDGALNTGSNSITVTNGTFDTGGFAVTAASLSSSNSNVRAIFLRTSTLTMTGGVAIDLTTSTNLTFNAGESSINCSDNGVLNFIGGGQTFHNVSFTGTTVTSRTIFGANVFNNLTFSVSGTANIQDAVFSADQTIIGTLNVQGGSVVRRTLVCSNTVGVARTLTVGTLLGNDSDFRDITIAGAAAGTTLLRSGDEGGNSGIVFPAPKTVYWNLSGSRDWSSAAWATSPGGTPSLNNFPLAQDTAVFDNTGAAGTITYDEPWSVRNIDGSARTAAVTFTLLFFPHIHGNVTLGTGFSSFAIEALGRNTTQTIITNGVSLSRLTIDALGSTVVLADALTATNTNLGIELVRGTFDAASYNVTTTNFNSSNSNTRSLIMGSGTWTLTHTGTVWDLTTNTNLTFNKGTANIVLSNNTTTARTFNGGGLAYNRLTIGGATSTSTTTIGSSNSFTELASTKTVAHTIALGTTTQSFGAWTVTGTVGNVVTLTGTGTSHSIHGAATSGIDYLAMGSIGFAATSPGEFYAGANSTGTAGAPVFRTVPPTPRTLYWVGGTGNWGDTARWSTASGGAGGAAVPTSLDNVIFDSASNATAYTATLNVIARCNQLTIAGPASGNLTLASSSVSNNLIVHGNTVFPATGFTRTFTSAIVLSGSTTGKTFTSNGVGFNGQGGGAMQVAGVGAGWSMTDALNLGANDALFLYDGTFSTNNFALTVAQINANSGGGSKTLNLGSSVVTMSGSSAPIQFGSTATVRNLLTFNAGTSTINVSVVNPSFGGNLQTFYDVSITTPTTLGTTSIGSATFRNLTFGPAPATGVQIIDVSSNITVTGTLAFTAGTDATRRNFFRSNTLGTTRTITAAAFSGTDVDFRDIAITGAAAPASGTRLGDCGGNSGITFPSPKTVYWNLAAGGGWGSTAWATTSGGTPAVNNFPLAQDTAIIENTGLNSAATITIGTSFNISSVDMTTRTTAMAFTVSVSTTFYGNLELGSGTTYSGSATLTFSGRKTQFLRTAGKTITGPITIESPGGSVVLQDSFTSNISSTFAFNLVAGTFNTNSFNVSLTGATSVFRFGSALATEVILGSESWTLAGSGTAWNALTTNVTISGTRTATINLTSASAKTFGGNGLNYGNITINNGGAGTLTIAGSNRFGNLTATQTATSAATISLTTTTQRLTQFTGKGESGRLLTIQGTSAASPATLVYTGSGAATTSVVDFLNIVGIRAYPLADTWYAGTNSTNGGTLGWIFSATPGGAAGTGNFLSLFL